jgi:hypothetical protein
VTTDRAAALLEDVLGEPPMLAGLLDAYGAKGGPLKESTQGALSHFGRMP